MVKAHRDCFTESVAEKQRWFKAAMWDTACAAVDPPGGARVNYGEAEISTPHCPRTETTCP
jgi:hypothetical protein